MNIAKIEENIQKILADLAPETFIYDLLVAYGKPKASITRLQRGTLNLSKTPGEIIWKKTCCSKRWHRNMDEAVDCCYRSKHFTSDEERLEYLFKLYEEMTQVEKRKAKAYA